MDDQCNYNMSNLNNFVTTTILKGKEELDKLEELQTILDDLDEKPQVIYTSYDVKSNI